ncbi:AAA family ATPase [Sphingopyxis indica]|uniref:AAA family ATPase n=1 Tax=Sphingopyxis indica TaxID=436663 RepID=UPI002938E206|nr:AAA family ATPase [Sphingopyxis indica]WOF44960.1 AAA family ATPase [Sphingopyxis indica]
MEVSLHPSSRDFYVLTGGPGSGKSTLLDHLEGHGFARSIEAGRGIIQDQIAIGGPALPWRDRALFAELMLSWDMRSYHAALQRDGSEPVIFDRGVPDVLGYLRFEGLNVRSHIQRAAKSFRYNPRVFVAPPWPEIYTQDAERKQDEETAHRTYEAMVIVYRELGYTLIELPKASVAARAEFVRAQIG